MVRPKRAAIAAAGSLAVALSVLAATGTGDTADHSGVGAAAGTPATKLSYNGLAQTPPMGWSDWFADGCDVDSGDITAAARELAVTGLAADGYRYVNVDDCWMSGSSGTTPNPATFPLPKPNPHHYPNGIASLAASIHADGLKFGIYQSVGTKACSHQPGDGPQFPGLYPASGNDYVAAYQAAADKFASWGVDYLKLDYCKVPKSLPAGGTPGDLFRAMSSALLHDSPDRPIVYSQELPLQYTAEIAKSPAAVTAGYATVTAGYDADVLSSSQMSNEWRFAPDETPNFQNSVISHFEQDLHVSQYAHPGSWSDLDFLTIGNARYEPGWTRAQQKAEMSIWSEMASPLILSANLASLGTRAHPTSALRILANKSVIAVDQDPLGIQGRLLTTVDGGLVDVVVKPLAGDAAEHGNLAVLFVNTSPAVSARVPSTVVASGKSSYTVTNLWPSAGPQQTTSTSGAISPGVLRPDSVAMYEIDTGPAGAAGTLAANAAALQGPTGPAPSAGDLASGAYLLRLRARQG
jgi:alpha-galactosidase